MQLPDLEPANKEKSFQPETPTVGAPAEFAEAEEMPGCISGCVTAIAAIPVIILEIPGFLIEGVVGLYATLGALYSIIVVFFLLLAACGCIFGVVLS